MNAPATAIVPLGRILRAEEADLYRDAAGALRAAEAAAIARRQAAIAALEAECADRRDAALRAAEQERARMLAETAAAAQRSVIALRRDIAEAIAEAVARIIHGIDLAEAVGRAAQRAVAELAERHAVVVHVHPSALERASARLAACGAGTRVLADAVLPPDGCIIETPAGFVRAGLAEQVETVRTALLAAAADDA